MEIHDVLHAPRMSSAHGGTRRGLTKHYTRYIAWAGARLNVGILNLLSHHVGRDVLRSLFRFGYFLCSLGRNVCSVGVIVAVHHGQEEEGCQEKDDAGGARGAGGGAQEIS